MNVLTFVFYGALASAVAASVGAVVVPTARTRLLVAAAVLYGVAGVLGILSIGLLFLVAATVCAVLALRQRTRPAAGL